MLVFSWAVVSGVVVLCNQTPVRWGAGLVVVYSSMFVTNVREFVKAVKMALGRGLHC